MNKKRKLKDKAKNSGFTLIEILVVLLIIGLLSTLVAVNVLPSQDRARIEKTKADIAVMGTALEIYRLERFNYPNSELGLRALLRPEEDNYQSNLNTRGYIKRLPKDPWGNDYQYAIPGDHGEYDLFSMGADGEIGGEGINADIGNWDPEVE
jgi:general secretion pathway protein G